MLSFGTLYEELASPLVNQLRLLRRNQIGQDPYLEGAGAARRRVVDGPRASETETTAVRGLAILVILLILHAISLGAPPYIADDSDPTEYRHWENLPGAAIR